MISITVENAFGRFEQTHEEGPLLVGREPNAPGSELVIADQYVSRRQLLLNPVGESHIRLENLGVNDLKLSDETRIARGESAEIPLPVLVYVGKSRLEIVWVDEVNSFLLDEDMATSDTHFETISAPAQSGSHRLAPAERLGDAPSSEELTRWFETLLAVQKSAFGTAEFYEETARALVELVGLDRGLILLKEGAGWKVKAGHAKRDNVTLAYSKSLVAQILEQKRTFFGCPANLASQESLVNLESVVASPVFGAEGDIVGILYGSRDFSSVMSRFGIRPLEAQVVQLLACAVSTGFARLAIEQKLKRMEQMAAVGQAIGYIIHDLRGPLGNLQQLLELSENDLHMTAAERRQLIDHALAASLDLLNDTLEFSRGKVRIKTERGPFLKLMDQHLKLFEMVLDEFGVDLEIDVPGDLVLSIDPDRMSRVLRNLIKNAGEALKGREGAKVTLRGRAEGDDALLFVADNGPGLPDAVRENLFQPFGTYGKSGGTGFGLAIAKQLVEAHKGKIDVSTGPKGTCFMIRLPRLSEIDDSGDSTLTFPEKSPNLRSEIRSDGLRILLADDSLVNQRLIGGHLANQGCAVITAGDGKEAVELFQSGPVDVILMDVEMPVMDGLEAARTIRRLEKLKGGRTTILAVTAHDSPEMHAEFLKAGMDNVLVKPLRIGELERMIEMRPS